VSEPRVCVLITSGGSWESGFGFDLARCMAFTASQGIALNISLVSGSMLPQNRTMLVKDAVARQATHYMWFDDDMRFPKETILRLLEHDKEIVCANYRWRNSPEKWVSYTKEVGYIETTENSSGLEQVTSIGFGVLMTKPEAFTKIDEPWFAIGCNQKTNEFLDEGSFACLKWFDAGVPIFIDHDLSKEVKHISQIELGLNYGAE
tara:strand:+ start:210 stop:824 length:615 start_codon:yes stop_codon:yes gene_type:complete